MITKKTVEDAVRLALDDVAEGFLSADEILSFILKHSRREQGWSYERISQGYYKYPGFLYLFNPSFDEEASVNYTHFSNGSIKVTSGTDSRSHITVTGCAVDFNNCVADILTWLATHKAKLISESNSAGSISPQTVRQELMSQASIWRGIYGMS